MSRDFRYKDFVNKLRFQVGGVCPDEFSEYGEKYIKGFVYAQSMKAAEALYREPSINAESCEIITQIIAEWTFHKVIDLMKAEIPEGFHEIVIKKINSAIYEHLKEQNAVSEFSYSDIDEDRDAYIASTETLVKDTYREALSQIYSDKGIDKDTYLWALEQSHFNEFAVALMDESERTYKYDVFELNSEWKDPLSLKELFKKDRLFFTFYPIAIFVSIILLTKAAMLHNRDGINYFFVLLLFCVARLCSLIYGRMKDICMVQISRFHQKLDEVESLCEGNSPNLMYERLGVDILAIHVGSALCDFCDPDIDNGLLPMIGELRKELTDRLGYIIPAVRCMDVTNSEPYGCEIYVRNVRRDSFTVDKGTTKSEFVAVLKKHLEETCIKYVNDVFTKTEVLKLMELVRSGNPTYVNDLIPELISAIDLRRIVVNLLREQIPVSDIMLIFERLCDFARFNNTADVLSERIRGELSDKICSMYSLRKDDKNILYALTFSEKFENYLLEKLVTTELGTMLMLSPEQCTDLYDKINSAMEALPEHKDDVVIIVPPKLRRPLFVFLSRILPFVKIMSFAELSDNIQVEVIANIEEA